MWIYPVAALTRINTSWSIKQLKNINLLYAHDFLSSSPAHLCSGFTLFCFKHWFNVSSCFYLLFPPLDSSLLSPLLLTVTSSAGDLPQVPPRSDSDPRSLPHRHEEGASAGSHRHDGAVRPPGARGQKAEVGQEENPRYGGSSGGHAHTIKKNTHGKSPVDYICLECAGFFFVWAKEKQWHLKVVLPKLFLCSL